MSLGIRETAWSIVLFMFIELLLISMGLVIMGGFGFEPMPVFLAIAENLATDTTPITVSDIAVFVFILGTFINVILFFYNTARAYF